MLDPPPPGAATEQPLLSEMASSLSEARDGSFLPFELGICVSDALGFGSERCCVSGSVSEKMFVPLGGLFVRALAPAPVSFDAFPALA